MGIAPNIARVLQKGGVASTGATAGTPGTFAPASSRPPLNAASAAAAQPNAVTATPGTAWTTGQRVVDRDGTTMYWNGTTWIAGIAP